MFKDLRAFIKKVEELGDCKIIQGADWDLEIGAITEIMLSASSSPLLLFDSIKGYPTSYRVATNVATTSQRTALALGLPLEAKGMALVQAWRDRIRGEMKLIPPVQVGSGPVKENIHLGNEVDVFEFPAPKWHELDGGRYIGTGDMVIMKDPDEGWVNLATHRVQIYEENNVATIYVAAPQQHSEMIRKKYWAKGQGCPVAVSLGQDLTLWSTANTRLPWGVSEYDYAGWLKGEPVELVKGETTGLPIPATAEIVLEGEIVPPNTETRIEGPFGEWTGYYASAPRAEPVFKIKCIMHRDSPILQGNPPLLGPYALGSHIRRPAAIWDALDRQIPGVKGVWGYEEVAGPGMVVISLEQKYEGHAKQAALIAAGCNFLEGKTKLIVVVDDDIDPSNLQEVLWALATRCDPETAVDTVRGCRGSPLDPILSPEKRQRGSSSNSKLLITACKPYSWIKEFPPSIKGSQELLAKTKAKWAELFKGT